MSLFDKLFTKQSQKVQADTWFKTLTAYQPRFTSWGGAIYESELVRAAIDAKARHISKLKVEFRGSAKPKLQTLVKHAPNEFQTWSQFLYRLATILEVQNTAFIVPVKDPVYETITGFYPILPQDCIIVQDKRGEAWLKYKFRTGDTAAERMSEVGVMSKFQYDSDFFGANNNALKATMELENIQNQGIAEAVKNGATFRFMAKMSNFATDEDIAKEQKRFGDTALKSDSGILLLPNTLSDVKQIESKPYTVDAEQMNAIKQNVYNYFGVNEKVMQNSAMGDDLDAFFNGCIEPFGIQLSDVMTKMTFSLREQSSGACIVVSSNRLQYMPISQKISMVQQMSDRGMLTINEARELFNYPLLENGDTTVIRGEYYQADDKLNPKEDENASQE